VRQTIPLGGGFRVTCDMAADWEPAGDGYALPARFEVAHPGTDGGPRLTLVFETRDGVPTCTCVQVDGAPDGREVRNQDLRGVPPIDQLADAAIEVLAGDVERDTDGNVTAVALRAETTPARRRFARRARAAAPRKSAVDLEEVARVYERHLGDAPTLAVAEHFGVRRATASAYATRAREAGFLTVTSSGGRPRTREEDT
jgi:hypothetical protein